MSRIGKKVITIPKGVTVTIRENELEVKGPKGTFRTPVPAGISFTQEGHQFQASRASDDLAAQHGLARALANNAIVAVPEGIDARAERVATKTSIPQYQTTLTLSGIDKQKLGQVAAEMHKLRKPDAYKGKGVRYADVPVKLKPGKTGK